MILAEYIRLSSADEDVKYGDKPESNSVTNQRKLLNRYIEDHPEFSGCTVREFHDDGRSGTNFNRPGVRALLDAARRREIDCIIVKDFSRFARNYLEAGHYLEQVFPFLGIRFIAVNEGYDSKNFPFGTAGDVSSGLLHLINEMYSRDLSAKSKTAKRMYAQRGQCISAYPIYGYLKSPEDKRAWIPDPVAAPVVRHIFEHFLEGKGPTEIARILNEEGIPTPSQHKRELGSARQLWNSERTDNFWSQSTVARILCDERYTGKLVAGKTTLSELGNIHSAKPLAKEDWIVVPGMFEAIISQEMFDTAQKQAETLRRPREPCKVERRIFYRKLKCAHCGSALMRREISKGIYYTCEGRAWNSTDSCKKIRLFETELTNTVLASIRFQAKLARKAEKQLEKQQTDIQKAKRRTLSAQQRIQAKIEQLAAQKAQAYVSYDLGELSSAGYEAQRRKINTAIAEQKNKLDRLKDDGESTSNMDMPVYDQMNTLKSLSGLHMLERETVEKLVHAIHVYDSDKIEIVWNFNEDDMRLLISGGEIMRGNN